VWQDIKFYIKHFGGIERLAMVGIKNGSTVWRCSFSRARRGFFLLRQDRDMDARIARAKVQHSRGKEKQRLEAPQEWGKVAKEQQT
jgi:hypothetical protein